MINVLQRLAELDAKNPNVVSNAPTPQAAVEAVQKTLSEELSVESLRYLSGVKSTLEECGMYPEGMGMSSGPTTPASFSINASAANGTEVADMLSQIMSLAGAGKAGPVTPDHMPLDMPHTSVSTVPPMNGNDEMKRVLDIMNDPPEDEGMMGDPNEEPGQLPLPAVANDSPANGGRRQTATMKFQDSDEEPGPSGIRKINPEPTITYDPPEDEGIGALAGAALGGPLGALGGAALGGAALGLAGAIGGGAMGGLAGADMGADIGHDIESEDSGSGPIPDVDISGVGGALAGAAIDGDLDGAIDGYEKGQDMTDAGGHEMNDIMKLAGLDKEKDTDEGSIQGGVWTADPPKPGQPNVPAPSEPDGGILNKTQPPKTPQPPPKTAPKKTSDSGEMDTMTAEVRNDVKGHLRKMMDMLDNSPSDPTDVPRLDPNKFAHQPNVGSGDRMDGNMPKGRVTAEDTMTSKLFSDYEKFVTEGEEKTMSRAAKGMMKYGKKGMKALADAGKEGKNLEPVRAKYNKYDEASHQTSTTMKHIKNPTAGEKKAGKDIKAGTAGYKDRVDMLKSAEKDGRLKGD